MAYTPVAADLHQPFEVHRDVFAQIPLDMPLVLDHLADPGEAMGVRLNAFAKSQAETSEILLHVLNYNVPLTPHPRGIPSRAMEDVEVRLPVGEETTVESVSALEPGKTEEVLDFTQEGESLRLRLARLEVYKLLRISCRNG